jgi:hypothetical protein
VTILYHTDRYAIPIGTETPPLRRNEAFTPPK